MSAAAEVIVRYSDGAVGLTGWGWFALFVFAVLVGK